MYVRYWNQLNEDIRILLQRFDAEYGDESEKKGWILLAIETYYWYIAACS